MGKYLDLTGQRFGRLVAVKDVGRYKASGGVLWLCKCDCGDTKIISSQSLRCGDIKSCGRYRMHGHSGDKIYGVWRSMKARCLNKKNPAYKYYGGRGITVCKEWLKFIFFYEWAMSHGYKDNLTIERTDNSLGYSPDNCIFTTWQEQAHNRRMQKNNISGYVGVWWHKEKKKYIVYLHVNKKRIHIGYFNDCKDAIRAREKAEIKYWGDSDNNRRQRCG